MGFIIFVIIVVFLVSQNNQKNKEENNALSEERDTRNSNKLESVVLDTQEKGSQLLGRAINRAIRITLLSTIHSLRGFIRGLFSK